MTILCGDSLEVMKKFEDCHFSAIVTDPPYGLSFMGKGWDHAVPGKEYWGECLRIVKPGGHLLAMGGTRTSHRLAVAIEDSGWEIRDTIAWIYGSGFPQSHNKFGIEGYGTALKPAHEPIIMCSKPYEINDILGIILLDLTEELCQWQKLSLDVNAADQNLRDSQVWLSRELKHIALESVKTSELEKLFDANLAIKNVIFPWQGWSEKINREKEFFARTSAKVDGKAENSKEKRILRGEEDVIFAGIRDIAISVTMVTTELNIGLLWNLILAGLCQGANKFTIKTAINLIIELKILKSCLSPTISKDTGNFSPDYQPIIMAMKKCDGTFKQNAEKWGQAGINIDGCRIPTNGENPKGSGTCTGNVNFKQGSTGNGGNETSPLGRWPAKLLLDEESAKNLDEQTGELKSGKVSPCFTPKKNSIYGKYAYRNPTYTCEASKGGGSRFFYCSKTSPKERGKGNKHPTVKPLLLMEYLIRLVMPPENGLLLDPFAGSGTTIIAAQNLGFSSIGIEKESEYAEIARERLKKAAYEKMMQRKSTMRLG
jgi:DNA modification methylase